MAEPYTNRADTSTRKRRCKRHKGGKKTARMMAITVIMAAILILIGTQVGKSPIS